MEAYIYDAVRTVRGKGNKKGALIGTTPVELTRQVLQTMKEKNDLDTTKVEDLILGCVSQVKDQGVNIAKTAAQAAQYGDHLCGVSLNRFCGSGLEAINQAAAYIKSGFSDLLIAGGVESMSRVPMGSDGGGPFLDPILMMQDNIVPQGISADLIASKYGYSRDDVDKFAYESQMRATKAEKAGLFTSRISVKDLSGINILTTDENIRPSTTVESLGTLKPSFAAMGKMAGFDGIAIDKYPEVEFIDHVHHAGNSSAIVDGASVALIGNKEIGKAMGLKPRFRIRAAAVTGTDPTMMLIGPAPASEKALKQAGMNISDIDLFEVNEAFAAVPMYFMEKLKVDHSIVNVNGAKHCAPGAVQHVGFNVSTREELLRMRDRIRSKGVPIYGPLGHGFCDSLYFAGPENMLLEIAWSEEAIHQDVWIDQEVVELAGISAEELERFKSPAPFVGQGGTVPQPPKDESKPHMVYDAPLGDKILEVPDEELLSR